MSKLIGLLMLTFSIMFCVPITASAKDTAAIVACANTALDFKPFKGTRAQRLYQARHQLPNTMLMINGVSTPLTSQFGATGECREAAALNASLSNETTALNNQIRQLTTERDAAIKARNAANAARDTAIRERNAAIKQRDTVTQESDGKNLIILVLCAGLVGTILLMAYTLLRTRKPAPKPQEKKAYDFDDTLNDTIDTSKDINQDHNDTVDALGDDTIEYFDNDSVNGGNDTLNGEVADINEPVVGNSNDTLGSDLDADRGGNDTPAERRSDTAAAA